MSEYWAPIILFISIAAVAISKLVLDFRLKKEFQVTVRKALENDSNVDSNTIEKLLQSSDNSRNDFKKAVTLLMLSIAIFIGTTLVNGGNAGYAIATFPLCLAIGFFIIYKSEQQRSE